MHHGRDVAFHEMRFIAVTADQVGQFLVADAGTSRWRALLGDAAPAPRVEGRSCGRLTGPLLGGVLAEHGLDDLGDELHDVSLVRGAWGAWGAIQFSWLMWPCRPCGVRKHSVLRERADGGLCSVMRPQPHVSRDAAADV